MGMRRIGTLLSVWLLTATVCAAWIWTNVALARTGRWLDMALGLLAAVLLVHWVEPLSRQVVRFRQRRPVVIVLILFTLLGVLGVLPEIVALGVDGSLASVYGEGAGALGLLARLLLISLAWGAVALLTAVALRALGSLLGPALSRQFGARFAAGRLGRIRRRHIVACAKLLVIAVLFLTVVISGPRLASTSRVPDSEWGRRDQAELPALLTMALDQRTGVLYAGTTRGVFTSKDGGVSWEPAVTEVDEQLVASMALDQKDGTVFVGVESGVFRSADGGANWTRTSLTDLEVLVTARGPGRGQLLTGLLDGDVGDAIGHQDSEEIGGSWLRDTEITSAALDTRGRVLYIGARQGVLIVTEDHGAWSVTSYGLRDVPVESLLVDSRDGTVYASTKGLGVYHSTNHGKDWVAGAVLPDAFASAFLLDEDSSVLYVGGRGQVFRSNDRGTTWQPASIGTHDPRVLVLLRDRERSTLYACTSGGVFFSSDSGTTWQTPSSTLTGTAVTALASGSEGLVYAGTLGHGVLRSVHTDGRWQTAAAGLAGANVQSLLVDDRTDILYAGTEGGLFSSADGGRTWNAASSELEDAVVLSIALDEKTDVLYVGTRGQGVWRSTDHATNWQPVGADVFGAPIAALAVDPVVGNVYAGTLGAGVFRSKDHGLSWQPIGSARELDFTWSLAADAQNHVLIAGTQSGVHRSRDSGETWQADALASQGMPVRALAVDEGMAVVYAAFEDHVARSEDGGLIWQTVGAPTRGFRVRGLLLARADGGMTTLYVGTGEGLYRTTDGGVTWQAVSGDAAAVSAWTGALTLEPRSGLVLAATSSWLSSAESTRGVRMVRSNVLSRAPGDALWQDLLVPVQDVSVQGLGVDLHTNTLYASGPGGLFSYDAVAGQWKSAAGGSPPCTLAGLFRSDSHYGIASRGPRGTRIWAVWGGGACWARVAAALDLPQAAIRPLPEGRAELYTIADGEFLQAEVQVGQNRVPLFWLMLRAVIDKSPVFGSSRSPRAVLGLVWLLVRLVPLLLIAIPILHGTLRLLSLPKDGRGHRVPLDVALQGWERLVRERLMRSGEVAHGDLSEVPASYRRLALRRFAEQRGGELGLVVRRGSLHLLNQDALRRWRLAWSIASRELDTRGELTETARDALQMMAEVLCQLLGLRFEAGAAEEHRAMRAYPVEGQALGLNTPRRFPLVFTADERPDEGTVHRLVEMLGIMHEPRFFAFVVPLESASRQLDTAAQLRRAIDNLTYPHDFVVLRNEDVEGMLVARNPDQVLSQRFYPQMDLKIISPFVYKGPVPETMFFGREAEIKLLLSKASTTDYAIVGNRQVGKTSLLKRLRTLMESSEELRPLWVDCQSVPTTSAFLEVFSNRTQIRLDRSTPEGLIVALSRARQQNGFPFVLLMDEVDALLCYEKQHGEPVVSAWRALAQEGICHFVFCGSRGLAERLSDGTSKFLNFGQEIRLGPLPPDEARLVLSRPMEKLGIALEDEDTFLNKVVDLTTGHPNLIQYIGAELVTTVNERKQRRIMLEDLAALEASKAFTDHFRDVVWSALEPLERLILLVMPAEGCSEREMQSALAARGVAVTSNQLAAAVQVLDVLSILKQESPGQPCTFVLRRFPEILRRYDMEWLIEGWKDELDQSKARTSV